MDAELAVKGGAANAEEDAQTPGGPAGVLNTAVGAYIVARDCMEGLLELAFIARGLPLGRCCHDGCFASI